MSLNNYKVLETVVQQRSFAKAAAVLHLTPSAVSHAITKLEEDLGIQLFVRDRKGVFLTVNGERLMPHIRAIRQSNELLQQEVEQIHGLLRGTVRVGTFNSVSVCWLPHIIKSFHKEYPDIDIRIYQGGYNEIIHWLKTNTVDLAFVVNNIVTDMQVLPLHKDMLVCVTPPDYVPINKNYVTIDDMRRMNLILQRDGYNTEVLDFFAKYNMKVTSSFFVESDDSLVSMVAAGLGYCIISKMIPVNPTSEVGVYPIVPYDFRTIGLVTVNQNSIAPATRKMRQQILNYVESNNLMNI